MWSKRPENATILPDDFITLDKFFMIRITYFLSGIVQGVGMRFTTLQIAQNFRVAGTVENLDDGRVKIVAEGESQELARFMESVQQLTNGRIKSIEQFESEPMNDFIDFSIKR